VSCIRYLLSPEFFSFSKVTVKWSPFLVVKRINRFLFNIKYPRQSKIFGLRSVNRKDYNQYFKTNVKKYKSWRTLGKTPRLNIMSKPSGKKVSRLMFLTRRHSMAYNSYKQYFVSLYSPIVNPNIMLNSDVFQKVVNNNLNYNLFLSLHSRISRFNNILKFKRFYIQSNDKLSGLKTFKLHKTLRSISRLYIARKLKFKRDFRKWLFLFRMMDPKLQRKLKLYNKYMRFSAYKRALKLYGIHSRVIGSVHRKLNKYLFVKRRYKNIIKLKLLHLLKNKSRNKRLFYQTYLHRLFGFTRFKKSLIRNNQIYFTKSLVSLIYKTKKLSIQRLCKLQAFVKNTRKLSLLQSVLFRSKLHLNCFKNLSLRNKFKQIVIKNALFNKNLLINRSQLNKLQSKLFFQAQIYNNGLNYNRRGIFRKNRIKILAWRPFKK
jgi:hypothetical protein